MAMPMPIAAAPATRMAIAAASAFAPISVIASNAKVFISSVSLYDMSYFPLFGGGTPCVGPKGRPSLKRRFAFCRSLNRPSLKETLFGLRGRKVGCFIFRAPRFAFIKNVSALILTCRRKAVGTVFVAESPFDGALKIGYSASPSERGALRPFRFLRAFCSSAEPSRVLDSLASP